MDEKSIPKFLVVEFGVSDGVGPQQALVATTHDTLVEAIEEALDTQLEQANEVRIYQLLELKTP